MKNNANERFVKAYTQTSFASGTVEVWIDRITGVNYMYIAYGYGGGLTPLLDAEGKPIVTPLPKG